MKKKELILRYSEFAFVKILPILLILQILVITNIYIFPLTDGWWETYAWLSNYGSLYKDIDFSLPPLYTNLIKLIMSFTNELILIRFTMLIIYFLNIYLIFKLCKKITNSNFAIIGLFVSQIMVINNNPVWLSKDYHTLVSLLVTLYSLQVFSLLSTKINNYKLLTIGIIVALIILTKQNIALLIVIATILLIILNHENYIVKIRKILYFIVGLLFVLFIYSYIFSFEWIQTYIANDSKGNTSTIFLRFIVDKDTSKITFNAFALAIIYIFFHKLYLIKEILINSNFNKIKNLEYKYNLSNAKNLLIYSTIIFAGYYVIIRGNNKYFYSLILAFFLIKSFSYLKNNKNALNGLSIVLILLAYAGTMTAGYNNVSLELLIAIFIAIFSAKIVTANNLKIEYLAVYISVICAVTFYKNKLSDDAYNWWGYSSGSILESKLRSENKKLKYIRMSPITFEVLNKTDYAISQLRPEDSIFSYPSIPIFYWLYDKKPNVRTIVQWFDVMPSKKMEPLLADLKSTQPDLIFWLKPPESVYQGHIRMKKTKLPMIEIDKYIESLITSGDYELKNAIPLGNLLDETSSMAYKKYINQPAEYSFICEDCSAEKMNSKLKKGDIISYSKSMDNENSKYISIIFKNQYKALDYISLTRTIPLQQKDWIFYIIKKN